MPFKFETSLQNPINQFRKAGKPDDALTLCLVAPQVGAAQKFYREEYSYCKRSIEVLLSQGNEEDNLYYALGIAAFVNQDKGIAQRHLPIALARAHHPKRVEHIELMLAALT